MALHRNYAIVSDDLVDKLVKIRGGYGLEDMADGSAEERQRWFAASNKQKARWEDRGPEPPTLGGWRHVRLKFQQNGAECDPGDLAGKPVIVELCSERPRQPHPTLGPVPRYVIYFRQMTGPADRVVRQVDIWRNPEDALFELEQEKGQYGRFLWTHSLSLFDNFEFTRQQYPRLVIYHPALLEVDPSGVFHNEDDIREAISELG